MLELSKSDAQKIRQKYLERLDETIKEIEKHFQDMDISNTNIDDRIYMLMLQTMAVCANAQRRLNTTNYKSIEDTYETRYTTKFLPTGVYIYKT